MYVKNSKLYLIHTNLLTKIVNSRLLVIEIRKGSNLLPKLDKTGKLLVGRWVEFLLEEGRIIKLIEEDIYTPDVLRLCIVGWYYEWWDLSEWKIWHFKARFLTQCSNNGQRFIDLIICNRCKLGLLLLNIRARIEHHFSL